jgi:cbb3-type cytochrome oxidase subunit 1
MMDWFTRWFIKSSLVWLCIGVVLGLAMAAHPAWTVYRPAHLHALLLGFVTMMIYGVAYHVIPRFSGFPLRHRTLAGVHWAVANIGLVAMVVGFVLRVSTTTTVGTTVLALGGTLSSAGAVVFAISMWRTIDGPRVRATPRRAGLPVAHT